VQGGTNLGPPRRVLRRDPPQRRSGADAPIGASYALVLAPGSYAITGSPALTVAGRALSAVPGSYTITGNAATLLAGGSLGIPASNLGPPRSVLRRDPPRRSSGFDGYLTFNAGLFTLAADPGNYSITGTAANLVAGGSTPPPASNIGPPRGALRRDPPRKQSGASGDLFGPVVTDDGISWRPEKSQRLLPPARSAPRRSGTTGDAAALGNSGAFSLALAPGSYSLTGSNALVVAGRALSAATGSYSVFGNAAKIVASRIISTAPGVYTISGSAASLVKTAQFSRVASSANTWLVPAQSRIFTAPAQSRTVKVAAQSRVYDVPGASRVWRVPAQSRIYEVS
jgi:hypothetical protein